MNSNYPTTDELKAHVAANLWIDGWVGTASITRENVTDAYCGHVPEYFAGAVLDEMASVGILNTADDLPGTAGWPPTKVSLCAQPDTVRDYIAENDPASLPPDLERLS